MLRSLYAGVSGLRNNQVRMDVIGNNIANVNTVAFKAGRVTFKEGFAQLLQGASRPPGDQGGINPIQIGLGMQIGSIDQIFNQGNLETTGLATDVAIQGDSFFVVRKGNQSFYTRAGNFQVDALGQLVSPANGFIVHGPHVRKRSGARWHPRHSFAVRSESVGQSDYRSHARGQPERVSPGVPGQLQRSDRSRQADQ